MARIAWWFIVAAACTAAAGATLPGGSRGPAVGPAAINLESLPERPLFRVFGTAQGSPSSTVHKLAQDREGNLWIATLDGLARFDGVDFTVWRHDPDQPGSLPGNDVQQVVIDEDDRVWVAVQDAGVARYDGDTGRFTSWRHDPADAGSLSTDRIWALADDGAGGIWAGGFRSGLIRLGADGHVGVFRHDPGDPASWCDDIILSLARTADTVWIGTAKGLCRWRQADGFSAIVIPDPGGQGGSLFISDIESDGEHLWLATSAGLRVVRIDGAPPAVAIPEALAAVPGAAVAIEPGGELWYGSNDGVRRWRIAGGEVIVHHAHPGQALALQAHNFLDVLRDHEGSLWFASEGGGLAQLLPHWRAIRVFLPNPDDPAALPSGRVRLVSADADAGIWIAANPDDGVAQLDPRNGQVVRWFEDGDGVSQPDPKALAVLRDRDGRVWTGNRGRVGRFDIATGAYRDVGADGGGAAFPATMVRRLAELPDDRVLAAFGGGGVARIDAATMHADYNPLGTARNLPCAEIADIRVDGAGRTWLACEHGVLRADAGSLDFTVVEGVPGGPVDSLDFTDAGEVWVHSLGLLGRYRSDGDALTATLSVGADDGWPVVKAGGIVVDGDGLVWATTSRGLFSYDPATRRVSSFDEHDGLPSAEFSATPPSAISPYLFAAGTVAGPVIVDTRRLREPLPRAVLRWHSASVVREGAPQQLAFAATGPIELAHDDRDLRVSVRLDSFAKPAANRYRFRLAGYDDGWIELTGQPERVFERLPSGRYELAVEAIGSDGQPAGNVLAQSFHVGLPPWRRPWAIALYVLLAALTGYALQRSYRLRLENRHALSLAEERQRWAEQASEAKTRFLASVGHEIRTPMAGLLGMNSLLLDSALDERQRHYARSVGHAGQHMLTLVNDLLDLSRIEAGQLVIDTAPVDLVALLDDLVGDAAAAAEKKGLILSQRIEPGTPLSVLADGKRLKQILLNFLSNAIKFTSVGHVRLALAMNGGQHEFSVQDEGPGLSAEMRGKLFTRYSQDELGRSSGGTGLGLSIAQELTALMGGDIGVDAPTGRGSRFWLRLPLAGSNAVPTIDAAGLPVLAVLDDDQWRGDDLLTSLAAVGACEVVPAGAAGAFLAADAVVLVASSGDDASAVARTNRLGLMANRCVMQLPLATGTPVQAAGRRYLAGPWRIGAVVEAVAALVAGSAGQALPQADAAKDAFARSHRPATPAIPAPLAVSAGGAAVAAQRVDTGDLPDLRGLHLLIVEDDEILREVLSARMSRMGATVAAVENGLLALGQLGSATFDAVLLDLDLPEIDGLQLLRLMSLRLGANAPPVIIVTARQQPDDEVQCRQAGARDFFRKPVDEQALAKRLLQVASQPLRA